MHECLWCQWLEKEARYHEAKRRLAQRLETKHQEGEAQAEFLAARAAISDIFEAIWPDQDGGSSCSSIPADPE